MRELLRGVLLAGGGSVVAIAFWAIVLKVMAVVAGPVGVGVFSMLRQLQQTAATVGMMNGQAALVQGLSSPAFSSRAYWREALKIIGIGLGLVVLLLLAGASLVARWTFGDAMLGATGLVRAMVPAVVLLVAVNCLGAVLTSRRALGAVATVQATSGVGALLLAWPAAVAAREGHLWQVVALLTSAAGVGFAASLVAVARTGGLPLHGDMPSHSARRRARSDFVATAVALLATGGLTVITPLLGRVLILRGRGLESVGLFDAAWTVSVTLVMLILAAIHAYYLPTLSGAPDAAARDDLTRRFFRLAALLVFPALVGAQALKPLLVQVLYSNAFTHAVVGMRWMLAGDLLLVGSWMLSIPILLAKDFWSYFLLQLVWNLGFLATVGWVASNVAWMDHVGLAFMVWHAIGFAIGLVLVALRYGLRLDKELLRTWLPGALLLALATAVTWNDQATNWAKATSLIAVAVLACYHLAGRPSLRALVRLPSNA